MFPHIRLHTEFSFHPLGEWNEMAVGDDVMKITLNQMYEKDPDT